MTTYDQNATYHKIANKKMLNEGELKRVDANGRPILLVMVKGKVYAMDAVCSHEGGPLEEGSLDGYEVKCPWHYAVFDVRDAKVSDQTVWATDLTSYNVKVDESTGDISIAFRSVPSEGQAPVKKERGSDDDASQKKYYEQEERKANKLELKLLSTEDLEGTDIMNFRLSRAGLEFSAGQYAFFELEGVTGDAKGPVRHFSIASSPTEEDLLISTRIRDTAYKQKLASLTPGAKISAWGPEGDFVLHEDFSKPAVFLSGGIGVTPFRSMAKYATDKQLPTEITLIDSNKSPQSALYREEFDSCAAKNQNLKIIYTVTEENGAAGPDWKGERGRIDKKMLTKYLTSEQLSKAIFYICGPPGMLKGMRDMLRKELEVPDKSIKIEAFTGY